MNKKIIFVIFQILWSLLFYKKATGKVNETLKLLFSTPQLESFHFLKQNGKNIIFCNQDNAFGKVRGKIYVIVYQLRQI